MKVYLVYLVGFLTAISTLIFCYKKKFKALKCIKRLTDRDLKRNNFYCGKYVVR